MRWWLNLSFFFPKTNHCHYGKFTSLLLYRWYATLTIFPLCILEPVESRQRWSWHGSQLPFRIKQRSLSPLITNQCFYARSQLGSATPTMLSSVEFSGKRSAYKQMKAKLRVLQCDRVLLDWLTIRLELAMIEIGNSEMISVQTNVAWASNFSTQCISVQSAGCCLTTVQITTVIRRKYSVLLRILELL